jgi:hypothetical protein
MMNNFILNMYNNDLIFLTNNLIMKTFAQLFFENNRFIINNGLLNKVKMD